MKKIMSVIGLSLLAGSLYAACMGPFCWDDTGASVNGNAFNGNGYVVPVLSSTTITALTPTIGQLVICNSCTTNAPGGYALCIATATTGTKFAISGSTYAAVSCK